MNMSLHQAIWKGEEALVNSLLDAGADINARDPHGWPPLSRAIERRQPAIAQLLLEIGADVHVRDQRNRQPLLWASEYGMADLAADLLRRGADAAAADDHGRTPLNQAIRHGRTATVRTLLKQGQWPAVSKKYCWSSGFFLAIRQRRFGIVKVFLDEDQSANSTIHSWKRNQLYEPTALMEAAASGDLGIVELLLRRGADLLKKSLRHSALTEALTHHGRQAPVTQALLDRGAPLGLEEAVAANDLVLAQRLLAEGADAELPDARARP